MSLSVFRMKTICQLRAFFPPHSAVTMSPPRLCLLYTSCAKAELINAILEMEKGPILVSGSGMAGMDSANRIHTRRALRRLYVCGDDTSEAREGVGLMAPRVTVCAGHQANMALRLRMGETEP